MGPLNIIDIILAGMKLLNWLSRKVDEHQWKASGKLEVRNELLVEFNERMGRVDKVIADGQGKTRTEKEQELKDD